MTDDTQIRIQKVLADAGVASRRAAEQMIMDGRVTVNESLVTSLPCFVTDADVVCVDGRKVSRQAARKAYYLLNKPRGVVCTQRDPQGRPRAVDLVPGDHGRIYCVGRLDLDSTGLVLLTNDGELTQQLAHPSYGVPKTYVVEVDGAMRGPQIEKVKAGVYLDGRRTAGARVKVLGRSRTRTVLEVVLTEGRNREIRRTLARVGAKVRRLKRVAIGPITDRGLKIGHVRTLAPREVTQLRRAAEAPPEAPVTPRKPAGRPKRTGKTAKKTTTRRAKESRR